MYHVDPFEVDESFADLQAEQHQSRICQLVLVLSQVVPELQECLSETGIPFQSLCHTFCHAEMHESSCNTIMRLMPELRKISVGCCSRVEQSNVLSN